MSNLTEKAAFIGTYSHMSANGLYPIAQSAYRANHNTETALLKVKNDILLNMNKQHVTHLVLLDLSAAIAQLKIYIDNCAIEINKIIIIIIIIIITSSLHFLSFILKICSFITDYFLLLISFMYCTLHFLIH